MKALVAAALSILMSVPAAMAKDPRAFSQNARTVIHADESYTESVQDITAREQREVTYSPKPQSVVIAKKVYLLDEKGQPLQGNIYDGRDQLKARAQFLYDSFGRLSEQRMFNLQGQVFQTITFGYDSNGKAQPPKSQTFNVAAPDMKPSTLDFTNQGTAPGQLDRSQGEPGQPARGNVPYAQDMPGNVTPSGGLAPIRPDANGNYAPAESEPGTKKKTGLLGRLFGGKKKEEKK
jgi:hypothetical protein